MAKRKEELQARFRYIEDRDAFRIETTTNGEEWDFAYEFPCYKANIIGGKYGDGEIDCISYQFATTLRELMHTGYKIVK